MKSRKRTPKERPDPTEADARLSAMNLLARREHSRRELQRKLGRRYPPDMLEAALDRLEEERLLSDERFAESFLRQRAGRGYGPQRIRQELRERGVTESLVTRAFEECEEDWSAQARQVLEKKFGNEAPVDDKEKSKRYRFMQYRGFGGEYYDL